MSDVPPVFFTVKEVAEILVLSTRTIHRYLASGDLTCHRIGRSIRISAEALEAYLASRAVVATSTRTDVARRAPARARQRAKVAAFLPHDGQKVLSPGVFNIPPRRAKNAS